MKFWTSVEICHCFPWYSYMASMIPSQGAGSWPPGLDVSARRDLKMKFPMKSELYMGVSKNSGIPKIIHSSRVFHYKPSILGYHYFWKHPYGLKFGYRFQHRKIAQRVLVGPLVGPGEFFGTIEIFKDRYFVVKIGNCWRSTTVLLTNHQKIISMFKKPDTWSKRATFCFVLFVFGLQLKVRYSPNRIHKVTRKFTNTDRSKVYFWFAWILNGFSMSFGRGWKATHLPWFSGRHCKWRGTTRWAASWGSWCCCSRSDENCSDNLGKTWGPTTNLNEFALGGDRWWFQMFFWCPPRKLGKWSNLTSIFFKWVENTN